MPGSRAQPQAICIRTIWARRQRRPTGQGRNSGGRTRILICRPSPTGPYGEERQDPAANDNDESFTGHIRDEDTGLIYAQARYMDPVIGRFLSGDPVGFSLLC
jgi:RHS repeat-associated protein